MARIAIEVGRAERKRRESWKIVSSREEMTEKEGKKEKGEKEEHRKGEKKERKKEGSI